MHGVTAQKSCYAEEQTFERAVFTDRGYRIFGTCWVKTAAGYKEGGYANLVKSDKYNQDIPQYLLNHMTKHLIFLPKDFPIPGIHPDK
jgi:hypothetical protein